VNLDSLAKRTPGFTGADLANLMNEAALLAARRDQSTITMKEFEASIDRVIAGSHKTETSLKLHQLLRLVHELDLLLASCSSLCRHGVPFRSDRAARRRELRRGGLGGHVDRRRRAGVDSWRRLRHLGQGQELLGRRHAR
jgi:hypothetical protein